MQEPHKKQPHNRVLRIDEFKERCLEFIAEIYRDGGTVIIADGDGPAAEITRYVESPLAGYGSLKGKVKILGEIDGPMPVEWYTNPDVQTDDDWDISGPMPASWFIVPEELKSREFRMPEKVDVSILHRHKFLTVNTSEFTAQLDEIIAAVAESYDGEVAVFDDEKGLVKLARFEENLVASDRVGKERTMKLEEIAFEVTETDAGGYSARAVGHSIFTQGDDWADLKAMVKDAVLCHFDDDEMPTEIRLRLVKDEVVAV